MNNADKPAFTNDHDLQTLAISYEGEFAGPPDLIAWRAGLTKREYFAAMAMQGILANAETEPEPVRIIRASVDMADFLLKALEES